MKPQYESIVIYIAANDDDKHLKLVTDTLDGKVGVVEIKIGHEKNEKSLGFFHIEQLANALETIKNSKLSYFKK